MSHNKSVRKNANGDGSMRKRTINKNGVEYTYWESRITIGFDPHTGKQVQKTFTGKTQREVREKANQAKYELEQGTYIAPSKMTVEEWMELWQRDYLFGIKESTARLYSKNIRLYILPYLGKIKLSDLSCQKVQRFYNELLHPTVSEKDPLAPKSIKNVHGILHKALDQAVKNELLRLNPTEGCVLPRMVKKDIQPLTEMQIKAFLALLPGHPHEYLYQIALFTGLREGELLGLPWDCVDLKSGTIQVKQQLQRVNGECHLVPPKNGKSRTLAIAPSVVQLFQKQKERQEAQKQDLGSAWENCGMVFTNPTGGYLSYRTVYDCFKRLVKKIGAPDARVHDLRHTYAVLSIQSGDDIKTVQENLGHATAAFTLDVYGHVSEQMKKRSADRLEATIQTIYNES